MADTGNYTDLFYSVNSDNWSIHPIPDYSLGRLPAHTSEQSITMTQKIIDYELRPPTDSTYYNAIFNFAGFEPKEILGLDSIWKKANTVEKLRFIKRSEEVRDYLSRLGYIVGRMYMKAHQYCNPAWYNSEYCTELDLSFPKDILFYNYDWNTSSDDIVNATNRGGIIQLYSYHGAQSGIGFTDQIWFGNDHISKLGNNKLLPTVFSINCNSGSFQNENAFLTNLLSYNNGGAVAAFGFTNSSYPVYNDCLLAGMIDAIWPYPGI